jgi:hypothetical protein
MKNTRKFWSYLAEFFLKWETFQTKILEEIKTHIVCPTTFFNENPAVYEIIQSAEGHRRKYKACVLHAGYLRPQTHTKNI